MRRALLNKIPIRCFINPPPSFKQNTNFDTPFTKFTSKIRFFSSENDNSSVEKPNLPPETSSIVKPPNKEHDVEDVSNKELKMQIQKYFNENDEEVLPTIFESVMRRRITRKHEDTDDELMDELRMEPVDGVEDDEFESDFEDLHDTDEEIDYLCDARDYVINKMVKDEFFYMDDKKWEDMIKEATDHGYLKDTKESEQILEDMFMWEKLLPDHLKEKVEKKYNEIADMVEAGELEVEQGYEMYKEFEHNMLMEHAKEFEEADTTKFDEIALPDRRKHSDDPPGEGPILRWETRVVFAPGGDAWHPKNRKAKMAVNVKELGLSKYQFRRLRELVGKRYNPGKDELIITSERFEHREENRKDCLRTLYALLEEAGKADKLVDDARTSYVKNKLRANIKFMEKLTAKVMRKEAANLLHA